MKYDVITIGSAFQDVYVFSKKFHVIKDKKAVTGESQTFAFGTKIELDDILFEVGGGATNTAYTFKRQGLRVACLTRVGVDGAGQEVENFLRVNKIDAFLVKDKRRRTAHSVIFLGPKGERTILVYRGASHYFSLSDVKLPLLHQAKWLYISSLAGNLPLLKKIVSFAAANRIKVALNPGKLEIFRAKDSTITNIFKNIDLLLLNHEEAQLVSGKKLAFGAPVLSVLQKLCPGTIAVTNGSAGAVLAAHSQRFRVRIRPVKAVDATGAGDSFGSGLLAGLVKYNGDVRKAAILAVNNSASDVLHIGAKHGQLDKGSKLNKVSYKFVEI